jgi:hypothetical protein
MYSNRSDGGRLPRNEDIIEKLRQYQKRHPGSEASGADTNPGSAGPGSGCG